MEEILKNPSTSKCVLPTWTTTVIYTLLALHHHAHNENEAGLAERMNVLSRLLSSLIPNETVVWKIFRGWAIDRIGSNVSFEEHGWEKWDTQVKNLSVDESQLLRDLREDATIAQFAYARKQGQTTQ